MCGTDNSESDSDYLEGEYESSNDDADDDTNDKGVPNIAMAV